MFNTKQHPIAHMALILCGLVIGVLIYLSLMGDYEYDLGASGNSYGSLPGLNENGRGVVTAASDGKAVKTNSVFSAFVNNDTIHVFWKRQGKQNIFYSTSTGSSWIKEKQLKYGSGDGSALDTDYGVEVITPGGQVCFFVKDGNMDAGDIDFSCSSTNTYAYASSTLSTPQEFSYTKTDDTSGTKVNLGKVRNIPSATLSIKHPATFYVAVSEKNSDNNKHYIKDFKCKFGTTLECTEGPIAAKKIEGYEPSILTVPNSEGFENYYVFYRQPNTNKIYYLSATSETRETTEPTLLENYEGVSYPATNRVATHFFTADNHVYIASRNEGDDGVRFARIHEVELLINNGSKQWKLCALKNQDGKNMLGTDEGPDLVEYNGELYIFYSDYSDEERLDYFRIDNIPPANSVPEGELDVCQFHDDDYDRPGGPV